MDWNTGFILALFGVTVLFLLAGFPVAFTLAGSALLVGSVGWVFGLFDPSYFQALPQRIFGIMTNEVLIAVPLFVFMGVLLERSKVAEDLLDTMGRLFGGLRGGLGISVIIVGALLAASTGIVGATVVTMGLLSLPTMLRRGYDRSLACGAICASGTLGQIIPPSIILVLLGDQISNAYSEAQMAIGNWSPDPVSVGDLFAGALLPGLMLVGLYILYQIGLALVRPQSCPPIPAEEFADMGALEWLGAMAQALLPPLLLILAVLGSILAGLATPTEAASIGAVGALLLAGARSRGDQGIMSALPVYLAAVGLVAALVLATFFDLRIAHVSRSQADLAALIAAFLAIGLSGWGIGLSLLRVWRADILRPVMQSTMEISAMVFVILIGAALFSLVFRGLEGDELVQSLLLNMPGGLTAAMISVMVLMFLLGFFLDFIEIIFVIVPIVGPVLLRTFDPVWLGVMMAMNLQTSFLTPPFGFSLFYLRGVAPEEIRTMDIYLGVIPFIIIQLIGLVLLALFPAMATWLPTQIFG